MMVDVHAYWDPARMPLNEMNRQIRQHGVGRVILSPPCTERFEPDKSPFMYAPQRFLLRNDLLRPIAEMSARSFYDGQGRLRPVWRLFTRSGQPINKVIVPDNAGLLEAIAPYESMCAWVWLNPGTVLFSEQIIRESSHPRVVGFKLHAYWHSFTAEQAEKVFFIAEETRRPIYLILGFGWLEGAVRFLEKFPSVHVIFGYGGFPYFSRLCRRILPFRNAWVDLTSNHLDERTIAEVVGILGPERCLYGSDCPYNFPDSAGRFDYSKTIGRIRGLHLDPQAEERILWRNAENLLFRQRPMIVEEPVR